LAKRWKAGGSAKIGSSLESPEKERGGGRKKASPKKGVGGSNIWGGEWVRDKDRGRNVRNHSRQQTKGKKKRNLLNRTKASLKKGQLVTSSNMLCCGWGATRRLKKRRRNSRRDGKKKAGQGGSKTC